MPDQNLNLSTIVTTLQNIQKSINTLNATIEAIFPGAATALTTSATGGSHAVPANAAQFLTVTINGVAYKVALFNP